MLSPTFLCSAAGDHTTAVVLFQEGLVIGISYVQQFNKMC